ncbi:MAG: hypothetical protein AB2A00_25195 [Myxococcota bacterium]
MKRTMRGLLGAVMALAFSGAAWAAPQQQKLTKASFADEVIQYEPTFSGGPTPRNRSPERAVGKPRGGGHDVSLGRGGLMELAFLDNLLTNSGDARPDLHVFEVGEDVEETFVAIMPADEATARAVAGLCQDQRRPFHDGFCEIGKIDGGTSSLDIDQYFPGFRAGQLRFNAVQLVDDENQGKVAGRTVGADIDAVAALSSVDSPDEIPATGTPLSLPATLPGTRLPAPSAPSLGQPAVSAPPVTTPGQPTVQGTPDSPQLHKLPRQ